MIHPAKGCYSAVSRVADFGAVVVNALLTILWIESVTVAPHHLIRLVPYNGILTLISEQKVTRTTSWNLYALT